MANTINANLQNNIIAQSALDAFTDILAPLRSFSQSFNDQAAEKGKTISVTTLANTSSTDDFAAGTGYESMNTTYGATQLSLTNHKYVSWHINDTEAAQSSAVELERFGYQKGGDLAKNVFEDILSDVTAANFTRSRVIAEADFDVDEIANLRQDMVSIGAMPNLCNIVVGPGSFASLLKDSKIVADAYGGTEAIRRGEVPSMFGFDGIYESQAIPDNSENLVGFVCHPSAMALAMRYLEPTNSQEYITTRRLSDPRTGMVLGYREFYQPTLGKQTAVLEAVYGSAVAIAEDLVRITSS